MDKKNFSLMKINEFAKLADVSTDTLRHYHELGLFEPIYIDSQTNYRYYSIEQLESLGTIRTLHNLGISLHEIQSFFNNRTISSSLLFFKQQSNRIQEKIERLTNEKKYIDKRILALETALSETDSQIHIKHFEKRFGYTNHVHCSKPSDIIRNAEVIIEKYTNKLFISNHYALLLPQEDILKKNFLDHIIVTILNIEKDANTPFYRVEFPAGDYLTLRHTSNAWHREPYLKQLHRYIKENHLQIIGDGLQVCIIDEYSTNNEEERIFELQIPIATK